MTQVTASSVLLLSMVYACTPNAPFRVPICRRGIADEAEGN
jgi:hypothetical protein